MRITILDQTFLMFPDSFFQVAGYTCIVTFILAEQDVNIIPFHSLLAPAALRQAQGDRLVKGF